MCVCSPRKNIHVFNFSEFAIFIISYALTVQQYVSNQRFSLTSILTNGQNESYTSRSQELQLDKTQERQKP